jgi:hypothetical protein
VPLARYANGPLRVDNAHDYLDVDRLYLDVYAGALDLRLGRQALNWGSAQVFNPTDPFPEVLLAEPWRPRHGVNAARLNLPLGESRDSVGGGGHRRRLWIRCAPPPAPASAGPAPTSPWWAPGGAARPGWSGWTCAAPWAWAGGWRAPTCSAPGTTRRWRPGIDYSWPVLERLVLFAEYYRNGAGKTAPAATDRAAGLAIAGPSCGGGVLPTFMPGPARDPFAPFTRARDYLLLGGALSVTPELNANLGFLQNLDDGSAVAIPTATWALRDWLELALSAQVPLAVWGHGELKPRPEDLQLQIPVPGAVAAVDLSGMVPAAVFTFWTRVSY